MMMMARIGAMAQFNCWGMYNQVTAKRIVSRKVICKYFLTHFLLLLINGATIKCVGRAQARLKLLRHESSIRMSQSVRITSPSNPNKKKKNTSNTRRILFVDTDFENCNTRTRIINNEKKYSGLNQLPEITFSGVGR